MKAVTLDPEYDLRITNHGSRITGPVAFSAARLHTVPHGYCFSGIGRVWDTFAGGLGASGHPDRASDYPTRPAGRAGKDDDAYAGGGVGHGARKNRDGGDGTDGGAGPPLGGWFDADGRCQCGETLELLRELKPDCLVVIAFGQKLSEELLAISPHRGINLHSSLLPKYRGAAPIHWAVINGDPQAGSA